MNESHWHIRLLQIDQDLLEGGECANDWWKVQLHRTRKASSYQLEAILKRDMKEYI